MRKGGSGLVSPVFIPGFNVLEVWVTASIWFPGKGYSFGRERNRDTPPHTHTLPGIFSLRPCMVKPETLD